ncbi:MAG: rhodanese-like domain-containing protein [Paenibacillaceae bacterium]
MQSNNMWKNISPQEVEAKISKGKEVQLIDVREPEEFATGRIVGSKLIPLSQFVERTNEINAEKEVICICRSGNRSAKACVHLSSIGFNNVKNMDGGMLEWKGDIEKN